MSHIAHVCTYGTRFYNALSNIVNWQRRSTIRTTNSRYSYRCRKATTICDIDRLCEMYTCACDRLRCGHRTISHRWTYDRWFSIVTRSVSMMSIVFETTIIFSEVLLAPFIILNQFDRFDVNVKTSGSGGMIATPRAVRHAVSLCVAALVDKDQKDKLRLGTKLSIYCIWLVRSELY